MTARRIIIAGGSGFIGRNLARHLSARGDQVTILRRSPREHSFYPHIREVPWDGATLGGWTKHLEGADAVVNLAGKNVNCRYTKNNLSEIDRSREDAVRVMAQAINACDHPPRVSVQASTTAIYGDAGERACDESSPLGEGIPVQTATKWETAFASTPTPRTRRVLLRISFVLGSDGGVLRFLAALTRCFMGGAVGTGRQVISWIHIDDLSRIFIRIIDDDSLAGLFNVSNDSPVTNERFMRELRRAMHRPWSPRVPAWMVRVGCFILRTEPVLALTGRRVVPKRLLEKHFKFEYTDLAKALPALLR